MDRNLLRLGAAFSFLGVALGAFATHALKDRLTQHSLDIFEIGVRYQVTHGLGLLLLALLAVHLDPKKIRRAGYTMTAGVLIFSGSLYALAATGVGILGAITPLGGLCLLASWAMVFFAA